MFATFRLECFGAGGDPPKLCEEAKNENEKQKQTRSLIFLYRATTKHPSSIIMAEEQRRQIEQLMGKENGSLIRRRDPEMTSSRVCRAF